jgi:hypothetical protein
MVEALCTRVGEFWYLSVYAVTMQEMRRTCNLGDLIALRYKYVIQLPFVAWELNRCSFQILCCDHISFQ